jgi:hypothetical protein
MARAFERPGTRAKRPGIAPEALLRAARPVLRPLVGLMVACGVTFPFAADLLRRLYVEAAQAVLKPPGRTDSRISLLTGVHRKEIRRLRETGGPPAESEPAVVTLSSQIIARWLGAAPFAEDGVPRLLPRLGEGASFEALVASITRDVRPRTILDDWLAQGLVAIDDQDCVSLQAAVYRPVPGREEQLFYFGRNLHDHAAAAVANVLATGPAPFLDRSLHYDRLTPEAADALETAARRAAEAMLLDLNRLALRLVDHGGDAPAGTAGARVNLGVYVFRENTPTDAAPKDTMP